MPLEIRPSTVSSMMLCPGRTMGRGNDGFNDKPSEALVFGTLVHARIEQHLLGKGEMSMHEKLHEIWLDDGGTEHEWKRLVPIDTRNKVVEGALLAYEKWYQNIRPFLPTTQAVVEEKLTSTIGMHPETNEAVTMFGTPDVVYPEEWLIVDWKTAGRGWDKKKMAGQMQPMAYNLLAADKYGFEETFSFQFYVYDRKAESWKLHDYGKPSLVAIDAFRAQAFGMALLSEGEPVYTPGGQGWAARGWHCDPRYCDSWSGCPGKHLINDGKANQRALRVQERGWK